jgi:hypothetical protein
MRIVIGLAPQAERLIDALGRRTGTPSTIADQWAVHRSVAAGSGTDTPPAGSGAAAAPGPRIAKREDAADARRALDRDVAAHHARTAAADGQAETGAPVTAGRRRVGLGELPEEPALLLGVSRCRCRHPKATTQSPSRSTRSTPAAIRPCSVNLRRC